jgi:uncharacterized protein YceK
MKKYLTVITLFVMFSGCQSTTTDVIPTKQTGAKASIHITRTQEQKIETGEVGGN